MRKFNTFALGIPVLLLSACSLQPEDYRSVRIHLPQYLEQTPGSYSLIDSLNYGSSFLSAPDPATWDDLDCVGINVFGEGIPLDSRVPNECPGTTPETKYYPGILAGLVPASGGIIDVLVPIGKNRTFQLIGMSSIMGCPYLNEYLNRDDHSGELGTPYELGRATVNVSSDTSIDIVASFDANKEVFCDGDDGHNHSPYELRLERNDGNGDAIAKGTCEILQFVAKDYTGPGEPLYYYVPEDVNFTVNLEGVSGVSFYADPSCTSPITSAGVNIATGTYDSNPLYVKSTNLTGYFGVHYSNMSTNAKDWNVWSELFAYISSGTLTGLQGHMHVEKAGELQVGECAIGEINFLEPTDYISSSGPISVTATDSGVAFYDMSDDSCEYPLYYGSLSDSIDGPRFWFRFKNTGTASTLNFWVDHNGFGINTPTLTVRH